MPYRSVDELQKLLAENVFGHTTDAKKAAGRSLGTLIEIITHYLIKQWGFDSYTTIEHKLQEFANDKILHNVEFALNPKSKEFDVEIEGISFPLTAKKIIGKFDELKEIKKFSSIKSVSILSEYDDHKILKNSCKMAYDEASNLVAVANLKDISTLNVSIVLDKPFAIFECKRVGIEESAGKGPTTIEKAKQGAYVALHASSFQKVRGLDGKMFGVIPKEDDKFIIKPYKEGLQYLIKEASIDELRNFILTVGVVSNHGNWFTSDNPNKELLVLMQSYDWLLFLTDDALAQFIEDLILDDKEDNYVRKAFLYSYVKPPPGKRKRNIFTKVNMSLDADQQIQEYFSKNIDQINNEWFNVIAPVGRDIEELKEQVDTLANKGWFP